MQDNILRDLENRIDSVVVFCDLSSAFDTLSHKNILGKLRVYGFTESSVRWYKSYLSKYLDVINHPDTCSAFRPFYSVSVSLLSLRTPA